MFKRQVGKGIEGKGVFKYYPPFFEIRSEELRSFLTGVKQRAEVKPAQKTGPAPDVRNAGRN